MVSGAFSVAGFAPGDAPAIWKSSQLRQPGVVFDVEAHKNDDEAHAVPSASSNGGGVLSGGAGAAAAASAGEAEEGEGREEEVNNAANNTQKFSCPLCLEEFKKWGKLRDHFKRSKHVVIDETTPKHTHKRQILELVCVLHQRQSAPLSTPTLPSIVTWMLVRGPRKGTNAVGGGRQRGVVGGGGGASNQCPKTPGYIDWETTQNREAQFQASQKEMLRRSRGFMSWIDSLKACVLEKGDGAINPSVSWNVVRANVDKPEWLITTPIKELLLTPEAQAAGLRFQSEGYRAAKTHVLRVITDADAELAHALNRELNGPDALQHDMSAMSHAHPHPHPPPHPRSHQVDHITSSNGNNTSQVSRENFDLTAQDFPDLHQGTELLLNRANNVACAAHGMGGGIRTDATISDLSSVEWLLALEDRFEPFLKPCAFWKPRERQLTEVPDEFANLQQYCSIIAHNMLVEFWHEHQKGPRAGNLRGRYLGASDLFLEGCKADQGMVHNLILISGSLHIVTKQEVAGIDKLWLTVKPPMREQATMQVESYGYIGGYITELAALIELAERPPHWGVSNVLKSVLCPRLDFPGRFESRELCTDVPINESQNQTVADLKYALEKIQGPPGTGKSTTIFHIINSRVPVGVKVLVTCSRNVAVESLAIKLEKLTHGGLVVFGNESRVGETAKRHLLEPKLQRQPAYVAVERIDKFSTEMQSAGSELIDGLRARQTLAIPCKSPLWRRAWCAYMRQKCLYPRLLGDWALRVALYGRTQVRKVADECQSEILGSSNIILCTIASTSRLLREWQEVCGKKPRIHTVIVDECGCTTESSTALLLRLNPTNLIMVGDHKQLPPTSTIRDEELAGTGHDRSLLARCCATASMHMLNEQYRMHEKICALVSYQFYDNLLLTSPTIVDDRRRKEKHPLIWVPVRGKEEFSPGAKRSYVNHDEIAAVLQVVTRLREEHPCASISVLTFYQGQLQELMRATPASLNVEVLTVDSCQGSEFDYVVLSTVRANSQRNIGFVQNKQRINVAISRSLYGLIVVGDDCTMSTDSDWEAVKKACKFRTADKWKLSLPLPAAGTFESVLDKLKREQKERKDQAMARYEFEAIKLMEEQPCFRNKKRHPKPLREQDPDDTHNLLGIPPLAECTPPDGGGGSEKDEDGDEDVYLESMSPLNGRASLHDNCGVVTEDAVQRKRRVESEADCAPASAPTPYPATGDETQATPEGNLQLGKENVRLAAMQRDHELAQSMQIGENAAYLDDMMQHMLETMRPTAVLEQRHAEVMKHLNTILKDIFGPDAFCTAYGSSVCDLAGKDADLDLTFTPAYAADKEEVLRTISKELHVRAKLINPPWRVQT
mmetsp:Transcript_28537/g.45829  ORF Transcript_28537/g.45829 Transcript_28537/m.45829 type:complete len:1349 (-) Transcript_28537:902-4948(-)